MKSFQQFQNDCEYIVLDEKLSGRVIDAAADVALAGAEKAGKLYRRLRYGNKTVPVTVRYIDAGGVNVTGRPTGNTRTVPGENIRGASPRPSTSSPQATGSPQKALPPGKPGGPLVDTTPKIRTNMNVPGGRKIPGLKSGGVLSGALGTADEKMKGSGWARSLAKGLTVGTGAVLGGIAGGTAGSVAGPVGTAVGGYAGQAAGAAAADKAFDTVAGANAVQRKAMATANRQRQAGGGLAGIGGKTTFSKGKGGTGFMSTGSGSQRKTVQLAKTSVVKDPKTGKAETGHLAFKGGQAVYKRAADPSTLAQTSSNPLERVGRSLFAGAYKTHDEKERQAKLKQAAQSDIKRQQALGVKGSKNLVGPKIVGSKTVGPKKVGPKIVGPSK